MPLSLQEALETSDSLSEKLATARDDAARENLHARKALVDCAAFDLFKHANFGKALAWGAGLGLPALGVGHTLLRDARNQSHEMLADARNQALITALGVGGMQSVGNALGHAFGPSAQPAPEQGMKLSAANDALLRKLAAVLTLDAFLCDQVVKVAGAAWDEAVECLLINRSLGVDILRGLR